MEIKNVVQQRAKIIAYCLKKLSNFENKTKAMSKNDEIKKLRERIEEQELMHRLLLATIKKQKNFKTQKY